MFRLYVLVIVATSCVRIGLCDEVNRNDRPVASPSASQSSGPQRVSPFDFTIRPLARIPAGTRFAEEPPAGWSNIILFVVPRLASGDVEAVSSTISHYSQLFNVAILANARQGSSGAFELEKVAIGTSMNIGGQNTIITSDSYKELGARLNVISSTVLSGNEKELANIAQTARSSTTMLIDAPLRMLYDDQHRLMTCRFAIWVVPTSGEIGTVVWLLDDPVPHQDDYVIVEDVFQYLPKNMKEDRVLNVREDQFFFGIPSESAFAAVRIPTGSPYVLTPEMRKYAGRRRVDDVSYHGLWKSITEASTRAPAP